MIYFIKGKVKYKYKNCIIIETGGLGYQIFITDSLLEKVQVGQDLNLFTYLKLRDEETIELYGFEKTRELEYFKLLKAISGIGPKSAINILSLIRLKDLERAILNKNLNTLTRVSGIGTKIAEKIILELKGKIEKTAHATPGPENDTLVIDALLSMGYTLIQARDAVKKIPPDILETKKRIKQALKILSGR